MTTHYYILADKSLRCLEPLNRRVLPYILTRSSPNSSGRLEGAVLLHPSYQTTCQGLRLKPTICENASSLSSVSVSVHSSPNLFTNFISLLISAASLVGKCFLKIRSYTKSGISTSKDLDSRFLPPSLASGSDRTEA